MANLNGKVALVTGASAPRGIGRAIARRLADDGAHVVVSDIGGSIDLDGVSLEREALMAATVEEIVAAGGSGESCVLDVSKPSDIASLVSSLVSRDSGVDILVNNAGSLAGSAPFLQTDASDWRTSFEVNLLGPVQLSHAVLPRMQQQRWGRIINIGSTGSLGAEPGFGAYTAMKHALAGFTKTLAAEFGPDGVLCNTVCPGFIATDMHTAANTRLAAESGRAVDAVRAERYASVALRDAGTPEDVANAVAFLASPAADYITGINLPVTGGVPYGI